MPHKFWLLLSVKIGPWVQHLLTANRCKSCKNRRKRLKQARL